MAAPVARLIEQRRAAPGRAGARVHALGLGVHRLGRGPGVDLVVDHPDVSRVHAQLEVLEEGFVVRDLGSKNGVRVGGQRVGSAELVDGGALELGGLVLVLEHPRARVLGLLREAGEPTLRRALPRGRPQGRERGRGREGVRELGRVLSREGGRDRAEHPSEHPSVVAPALACLAFTALLAVLLGSS